MINMDEKHVTLVVFLDLSAACIRYCGPRDPDFAFKIKFWYKRQSPKWLNWFIFYLTDRSQRISLNGHVSNSFPLPQEVPQGSCLGTLLFTYFTIYFQQIISSHKKSSSRCHEYADDSELYLSFKPDSQLNQDEALNAMERCVEDIRTWMIVHKLKMNEGKTEFLVFGAKQQLCEVNVDPLTAGGSKIDPKSVVKTLGTWLDSNLNLQEHITKTCRASFFHLNNIRRIRKYLSKESMQTLVQALIIGHLDYCNRPHELTA